MHILGFHGICLDKCLWHLPIPNKHMKYREMLGRRLKRICYKMLQCIYATLGATGGTAQGGIIHSDVMNFTQIRHTG